MMWYTSDWHLFHKNIIKLSNRPFDTMDNMIETFITNYNTKITMDDTCVFVGDISFAGSVRTRSIIDRLNGVKIMVLGNHDRGAGKALRSGFSLAVTEYKTMFHNTAILVKHFPFKPDPLPDPLPDYMARYLDYQPTDDGKTWLIHGHTHNKTQQKGRMLHVGVDAHNFNPVPQTWIESCVQRGVFK